jgi:hypothetical protein
MTQTTAATAIATHHSITTYDAECLLDRLGVTDAADLDYVAEHPEALTAWTDDSTADRCCGYTGWVIWWEESHCATSITNGDAVHHEGIASLDDAVAAGRGDEDLDEDTE